MVNSEQKGQEEKEVALDHAHVPTLVYIRIGGCLVGNTEVLRNHTTDRKHNINVVCHPIITILAFRICTAASCFPLLVRVPTAGISTNRINCGQSIEGIACCS